MKIKIRGKEFVVEDTHESFWKGISEWEPGTFAAMKYFIKPDKPYIDIGAWIGPTVLYGASLTSSRVYAIEPNPDSFAILKRNLELNKSKAHISHTALDPFCCKLPLSIPEEGSQSSFYPHKKEKKRVIVQGTSFDCWKMQVGTEEVDKCNFVKMDIEGAEAEVIPSMTKWLRTFKPTLCISLHPHICLVDKVMGCIYFYKHFYFENGRKTSLCEIARELKEKKGTITLICSEEEWK